MGRGIYIYIGARGSTVIDYIFVNTQVSDRILECKVEERIDSDHLSISLKMETRNEEREIKKRQIRIGKKETEEINKIVCWSPEARKEYRETTEEIG